MAEATPQDLMGNTVFCTSLAGEEIGRMRTWGTHPCRQARLHGGQPVRGSATCRRPAWSRCSSTTAASRGAQVALRHRVSVARSRTPTASPRTVRDRLRGDEYDDPRQVPHRRRRRHAARSPRTSGCRSSGQMGVGGSINIVFKADLSHLRRPPPRVLYWVMQPGRGRRRHRHGPGAHGAAVERVADRLGLRHRRRRRRTSTEE